MTNERFTNPFPGLRPFESNEDHLFFGRDGQSDELLRRLRRSRFLAVLGTSGSGKSSLVRAGMLPSLFGGLMTQAGSGWRVALFRPGQDPIGHLASALADSQVFGAGTDDAALQKTIIEATLRRSALGLVEATKQARIPANENLLIVVDQFEEIFRFRRMAKRDGFEDEAAAFIKLLLEAKRYTEVPVYIVITMRSDFLGDCAQFRDLPEAINDGQYLIPRMTRDQRREAITGPVAVGGGEISPRLVNRLLNDVGDDPDHLPILQHALMRTWDLWTHDRRNREPIDLRHYEAVGTLSDALSRHADEAYAELPNDRSRALAEKVFKSLTEKGPDNREIRRPTRVSEICEIAAASTAEVIAVIEPFRRPGRSFLMPPASVKLTADSLIDISHESLIRGWERLRKWVDQEARSANIYRRIADTALLHREGHAGLWHDPDLALALRWREENHPNAVWAQHYHPEFGLAMKFLDESKAANEAEIAERERARKKEVRRTRIFASVFGVLFLISAGFGVFAFDAKKKADVARNEALDEKKRADNARADAIKEKNNARESEQRAVANEEIARNEKKKAEEAATVAEQRRQEAERATELAHHAQTIAEQRRRDAEKSAAEAEAAAQESLRAAMRGRRQGMNDKSSIMTLAERLIQVTSPEEAAYWRSYYATALAEVGRADLSKTESTKQLEMFGNNINALTNRGYMSLIRFETSEALEDFERARELDPQNSLNYLNLGVTQANLKDYSGAKNAIEKAIQWYRPGFLDNVFDSEVSDDIKQATHRSIIYADGNEFNTALYYELANIEAFRGGRDFERVLAQADENAARTASSIEGYLTALNWAWLQRRKYPKDYGAWAMEAHLWRKAGYDDWASYYFQRFQCEHEKNNDSRYAALADWVKSQQRTLAKGSAQVDCESSSFRPPRSKTDVRTRLVEANELAYIGRYDEAVSLLQSDIDFDPDNIDLLLAQARFLERSGYYAGYWASKYKEQGKSEDAKFEENLRKTNFDASRKDFARLLELSEKKPEYKPIVYLWWGYLGPEIASLPNDERRRYFEKATELGPADAGVLAELSDAAASTDRARAIELLKRSLAISQSAVNYYKLAILENQANNFREALESIKLAIAMEKDNPKYYEERKTAEAGLGLSEVEQGRHLAQGYMDVGDSRFRESLTETDASAKQNAIAAARDSYQASLDTLSRLPKSEAVAADIAIINSKIARLEEATPAPRK